MSNKISIALPAVGQRYYITIPSDVKPNIDFKIWGAGGGGGGNDSHIGGNGAGGNFINGTMPVTAGDSLSVFVGNGGGAGASGTQGGGASGGAGHESYNGGRGGNSGYGGSSGAGGGGGASTLIILNGQVRAVAGGGGGGGGGGNHSNGISATGGYNGTPAGNRYTGGMSNGAWSNVLNNYSIWEGSGTYTWYQYFPYTGTYTIKSSIDNYGSIYIDGTLVANVPSYETVYTSTVHIEAGIHTITISAVNTGGPGAIGAVIEYNDSVVWSSRYPYKQTGKGGNGENKNGDGAGGGGGGGGHRGGYGGVTVDGDNGAYGGGNGANFMIGYNASNIGAYGSLRNAAGMSDTDYVSGVGMGGTYGGGVGGNGYAVLTFYSTVGTYIRQNETYMPVAPYVKINKSYRYATPWVKSNGVWTPVLNTPTITFSNDLTNWG